MKIIATLVVLIGVVFGIMRYIDPGLAGTGNTALPGVSATTTNTPEGATKTYQNGAHNILFAYPADYVLTEREVGTGERGHYVITLVQKDVPAAPEGGEGPPQVTVEVFQNNIDKTPLDAWIKNTSASNYKLSPDGALSPAIDDAKGRVSKSWRWSGLYEGASTAFVHGTDIVMVSYQWMAAGENKQAYDTILSTFTSAQ